MMTGKKPAFLMFMMATAVGCSFAAEKATDLMSLALKNKAAGKTVLAAEQLQKAIKQANSDMQKNLARFMLGDCQIESGQYSQASITYQQLRESDLSGEEMAEATYRLMQAESFAGNQKKARRLFDEIHKNHRSSPYYELAQSFYQAQKHISVPVTEEKTMPVRRTEPQSPRPEPAKETAIAKAVTDKIVEKPVEEVKEAKPVQPAEPSSEPSVEPVKPAMEVPRPAISASKPDSALIETLREALAVEIRENKDDLVPEILRLQDQLKENHGKPGTDQILFDLAGLTLEFGETLEACKLYDQILNQHPTSVNVERAYYEAIRLRAVLGVHEAVISWGKAFMAAFPASEYGSRVKALLHYSGKNGQIELIGPPKNQKPLREKPAVKQPAKTGSAIEKDNLYLQASRKMKDGKYNLALADLKKLAVQYPDSPQIWWDLTLVNVQSENFPEAETAVKKLLLLDPDNEEANSLLGYIHYRLEDYQQAASAYDRAGEPEGKGVTFFDAKKAAERMKKTVDTDR
ncbi:MAG: tetratricopeptide repeat protein [Candidatus Rifleibacteriota bacterium]